MTTSYEHQLEIVQRLPPSSSDNDRHIEWCINSGPVGLARTPKGGIEIFLEGPQLAPRLRRVRDAVEYQRWYRSGGGQLLASRILLPSAGHFEQVAAFLCTELLRNRADVDLGRAFAETEPLIELAISDLLIADETFVGLCGELLVLHAMALASPVERLVDVLDSWKGYRDTARDLQVGLVGIEVKTTTSVSSSHLFRGVHQIELGHGVDGAVEEAFLLASLGLEWTDPDDEENTTSLPELLDGLISRVVGLRGASADAVVAELLERSRSYGASTDVGYDHRTMAGNARFRRRFRLAFARGYDMSDPSIRLLTTDDMRARPFIDLDSLRLRVNLPDQVSGDLNPVVGLSHCVKWVQDRCGWLDVND